MSEGEVIPVIPIPRSRKAKASVWRDIGVAETDYALKLSEVDETKSYLMDTFRIGEDPNGRHLIVADMFYYALQFCKDSSFDSEKTSSLLSILKQTHEMATETPFGNIRQTLDFFKNLLLCHSVHRPPFSLGIFSQPEAVAISNYFIDSYFRHFKLYKYIFTPQVQLDLTIGYTKFPRSTKDSSDGSKIGQNEGPESAKTSNDVVDLSAYTADQSPERAADERGEDDAPPPVDEDADAAGEFDPSAESIGALKRLIRERLAAEVQQLRSGIATKLQQSDETIGKLAADAAADSGKRQAAKKKK